MSVVVACVSSLCVVAMVTEESTGFPGARVGGDCELPCANHTWILCKTSKCFDSWVDFSQFHWLTKFFRPAGLGFHVLSYIESFFSGDSLHFLFKIFPL